MPEDGSVQDAGPGITNIGEGDTPSVDGVEGNKQNLKERFFWNLYGWSYDNSLCGRL